MGFVVPVVLDKGGTGLATARTSFEHVPIVDFALSIFGPFCTLFVGIDAFSRDENGFQFAARDIVMLIYSVVGVGRIV